MTVVGTRASRQGWEGWDQYAPFYDWENARTLGRRDVPFWQRLTAQATGPVLELGCGTGRISVPLARTGATLVGVDRSEQMLARALARTSKTSRTSGTVSFVRADIRALPFGRRRFAMVLAPYGVLQSLVSDRDLRATLDSVARVIRRGGTFGIDLVPDVPNWREYQNKVQLSGRAPGGTHLTLVESVHQDPKRRLTTFEQRYIERRRGGRSREHRFDLTFRTLGVPQMRRRVERAGFRVKTVLGDYLGRPWDARADVWIILAEKV
jgi:ubiquinone/menaquinone biosynthesis C-methylase UbiE